MPALLRTCGIVAFFHLGLRRWVPAVKPLSLLRRLHLAYSSQPKADRAVYRVAISRKPKRILELGIGMAQRSTRLLTIANAYAETESITYAGVDLFEARPASAPGTTLKRAHKLLRPLAGSLRLVPGEPFPALMQLANAAGKVDLIVIGADQEPASLTQAWFYVPRMLSEETVVLLETATGKEDTSKFVQLPHGEVQRLADAAAPRRRAA